MECFKQNAWRKKRNHLIRKISNFSHTWHKHQYTQINGMINKKDREDVGKERKK